MAFKILRISPLMHPRLTPLLGELPAEYALCYVHIRYIPSILTGVILDNQVNLDGLQGT